MNEEVESRPVRGRRLFMILVAILALSLMAAACGDDDDPVADPATPAGDTPEEVANADEESGSDAPEDEGAEGDGDTYKVAVLTVGSEGDQGFGQAWAEAAANADALDGVEVDFVSGLASPDQYESQATAFANAGFDLVVIAHGGMSPVGVTVAENFPDVTVCVTPVPGPPEGPLPANSCFFDVEQQIGAFRSGVLAATLNETGTVAVLQSYDFPAVTRQVEAFKLGARCVNPDIIIVSEITNDDTDQAIAKAATEALIQQGADIIMGTHSAATAGTFQAAQETPGTYAIGQYVDSQASAPGVVLGSNLANFQDVFPDFVAKARDGDVTGFQSYGIDSTVEVGRLTENADLLATFSEEALSQNAALQQRITDGDIEVPDTALIDQIGKSDSIDPVSLGCDAG